MSEENLKNRDLIGLLDEQSTKIRALEAERDELREALAPFAKPPLLRIVCPECWHESYQRAPTSEESRRAKALVGGEDD